MNPYRTARYGLGVLLAATLLGTKAPAQEREPLAVYQQRRAALQQRLENGLIVLFGNTESSGSEALRVFRQESNFYYLTGLDEPNAVLLLAPPDRQSAAQPPREILFLPPSNRQEERWTGPKPDPSDPAAPAQTGVATVKDREALEGEIRRYAQEYSALYTLLPESYGSDSAQALAKERVNKLRAIAPSSRIQEARQAMAGLRQVKSETELSLIRRAVDCTIEAHAAAARAVRPGLWEYEIAALMKYTFARAGCLQPSFDPIVASGLRSTILHYNRNLARMESGDLVVLDVGGEYAHYAADITRTLPVNGRFTSRQREIYEIVLGAQKAAIQAVKPGMRLAGRGQESLHQIAYNYINTHGKDREGKPLGKYFLHGLSHHVGLDVHDAAARDAPLEPGMVITIEPGIYLPDENIGVRIEDMLLVTEEGYVLLTAKLPRDADAIEQWLQK